MTDNRLLTRVRNATHNTGRFYFSTRNQSFYLTLQRMQHRLTTKKHNTQSPPVTFSAVSYADCVYICQDRCYTYACCSMFHPFVLAVTHIRPPVWNRHTNFTYSVVLSSTEGSTDKALALRNHVRRKAQQLQKRNCCTQPSWPIPPSCRRLTTDSSSWSTEEEFKTCSKCSTDPLRYE